MKIKIVCEESPNAGIVVLTREDWLQRATLLLRPLFLATGSPLPDRLHISVGFPSTRALSRKNRRVGECWAEAASRDNLHHLFISPVIGEPIETLGVLVHELVHAAVGGKCGHRGAFKRVAGKMGLEGKMTSTTVGEELGRKLEEVVRALPAYPHAMLDPRERPTKKQGTRQLKAQCSRKKACGMIIRTTRKWMEEVGLPTCACGGRFVEEETDEEDDDDEEEEG